MISTALSRRQFMNGSYQGEIERGPRQLTLWNSTRPEGVGNLETVSPTEEGILLRVS